MKLSIISLLFFVILVSSCKSDSDYYAVRDHALTCMKDAQLESKIGCLNQHQIWSHEVNPYLSEKDNADFKKGLLKHRQIAKSKIDSIRSDIQNMKTYENHTKEIKAIEDLFFCIEELYRLSGERDLNLDAYWPHCNEQIMKTEKAITSFEERFVEFKGH